MNIESRRWKICQYMQMYALDMSAGISKSRTMCHIVFLLYGAKEKSA